MQIIKKISTIVAPSNRFKRRFLMTAIDTLITARWILPIIPRGMLHEHHAIAIQNGRITEILPTDLALQKYQPKKLIRRDDQILMPGLINAHAHTPMNLFRGLADDLKLMDWLTQHIWPVEAEIINAETVEIGSRLAIAEMISGGTTCFNDHYFFPHITAKVAVEEGFRAMLGIVTMDVPNLWAKDAEEGLKKGLQVYRESPKDDLIRYTLAPQGPYTNSDKTLSKVKELSEELNLRVHIHLQETLDEIKGEIERHGKRPIARLDHLGLINSKLIAVHMVHLIEEEIKLLQQRGVHVVHCPESNLKLASGFAPITLLQQHRINVALGTDGAASNNDLDMFGEMRTAAFIAKAINRDSTALPAEDVLEMATINGAKALGWDQEIGSLEKGKMADIIGINLNSFLTQPVYNPISHLVYAVNRLQVEDVWIAGKQLLDRGEFTQLDIKRTLKQAEPWFAKSARYQTHTRGIKTKQTV